MIRQSLYISVTTSKVELYFIEGASQIFRVLPSEAVHRDIDGGVYVWVLSEDDDIGEKYYYAEKTFVEILAQDDIYTGIRGIIEGTVVIVTSASELEDKARVKVRGEYEG